MKKLISILLAALMLAACASAALADVSASYSDGKITVSCPDEGFWEISIDGTWVGYWVGALHPVHTFSMKLEEGEHTVSIFSVDANARMASTFMVGDAQPGQAEPAPGGDAPQDKPDSQPATAPAETPAPTGPVNLDNASYAKGVMNLRVSGLRGYAEIWLDGKNTGLTVTENGEIAILKIAEKGEHTLALYVPAYDELSTQEFYAPEFAPDAEAVRPVLDSLMKNEKGETVGTGLAIDLDEESYVLRISVDNEPGALLTLTKEQIALLLSEGLNVIEYRNGAAALRINLTKITDDWFMTNEPITAYTFALTAEEGSASLVVVSALTQENKPVEATLLNGITLLRNNQRIEVTRNGVY